MESITLKSSSSSSSSSPEPSIINKSNPIGVIKSQPITEQNEKKAHNRLDGFGDHVCRLLNEGALRNINTSNVKHSFQFVPLFSASNVRWLQEKYTSIQTALSMNTPFGNQRPTISQSLGVFVSILFFSSLAITALTAIFLTIVIRVYIFVLLTVLSFLFDLNDLYDYLPKEIHVFIGRIKACWDKIDDRYLHANDLNGRNLWCDDEDVLRLDLVERRIPSSLHHMIDSNGNIQSEDDMHALDWHTLQEELYSKGLETTTIDHNLAVNFCCVMVHGKHSPLLNVHKKDFQQVVKTIIDLGKVDGKQPEVEKKLLLELDDDIHSHSNEDQVMDQHPFHEVRLSKSCDVADDLSALDLRGSGSDAGQKWLDVGTKLGLRLLQSETVKAVLQTKSTDKPHIEEDLVLDTIEDGDMVVSTDRVRPFHPMWSPGLGDHESVHSIVSESECHDDDSQVSTESFDVKVRSKFVSPRSSPSKLVSRRLYYNQMGSSRHSSPSSSIRSFSRMKENMNVCDNSHGNSHITSPIQWVPKAFDASKHLPAALALNDTGTTSKPITDSKMCSKPIPKTKHVIKTKQYKKRSPLLPGVKMLIPISKSSSQKSYQLVTIYSCARIQLDTSLYGGSEHDQTDALSICAYIDKSFLRNGCFAMISLRIPDSQRQLPR
jgi:hypothetical protein